MPLSRFFRPLTLLLIATLSAGAVQAQEDTPKDRAALERQIFDVLERSHWVAEGAENPDRVVYTFTDLKCPYCERQWRDMRPLLADPDNRTQVRHVVVAVLRPGSYGEGAAVLAADDPAAALAQGEKGELKPLDPVPEAMGRQLRENNALMREFGIRGTPATIFRDPAGKLEFAPGVLQPETLRGLVFQLD
ncbi:thiol:disulfide interchange protein DsbG [Alloalcanivorax sp. C16-1]|uniref:thiol:disulfide interchange protein DsbG n=1 Tax=Alloalcanivorax sp. C16-1 TaxID=3390051 RepID=UPI003970687A